ncbi:MAG: YceI family protein [Proteobacteria bacterium]|nr:YceI family protein [Pseudomonadota bacterium]
MAFVLGVALLCCPAAGRAGTVFPIDQRYGSIDFSVDHLGLFTSHGDFRRFSGTLTIDTEHPERTEIKVMIDAQSVEMDSSDGQAMVRSADYFDVDRHPVIVFRSGRVRQESPDHYRIEGTIRIRDIERPITLEAVLTGHPRGPSGPASEFVVDGSLNRGEFGMVSDRNFVSDTVHIHVTARIALDHVPRLPAGQAAAAPNAG